MQRILVIDDERAIRDVLAILLERKGYEVVLAEDGLKGMAWAQHHRLDAVALDWEMSGMHGSDVLQELRRLYPQVPVLIFTGAGTEDVASEAKALGAVVCLRKGFSLHQLGETLQRLLPSLGNPLAH